MGHEQDSGNLMVVTIHGQWKEVTSPGKASGLNPLSGPDRPAGVVGVIASLVASAMAFLAIALVGASGRWWWWKAHAELFFGHILPPIFGDGGGVLLLYLS